VASLSVKREDHQAAIRVHQPRLKPTPVTFEDLRCYVWMNDSRLEDFRLQKVLLDYLVGAGEQ